MASSGWNWRERKSALRVRLQNGTDALASMRNCKTPELKFRALLLTEGASAVKLALV
jgi:hypothetical protein